MAVKLQNFQQRFQLEEKETIGLWKWCLHSGMEVSGRQKICNLFRRHDANFSWVGQLYVVVICVNLCDHVLRFQGMGGRLNGKLRF